MTIPDTNPVRPEFGPLRRTVEPFYEEDGFSARCLFNGESCVIVEGRTSPAGRGPSRDVVAECDQFMFVVEGELEVEAGEETHHFGAETLLFLPMGTSLSFRNGGDSETRHVHVYTPAPVFGRQIWTSVDAPVTVGKPVVRRVVDVESQSPMPSFRARLLLNEDDGSTHANFPHLIVPPGGAGPPLHYHRFDMFYYIREGELTIEYALEGRFTARPGDLVALAAGAPHAQYNEGDVPEVHLAINAPHPVGLPWDVRVHLTPRERT